MDKNKTLQVRNKTMDKSVVQEFYKNSKIFITGGTGFMGKILIEKLLRDTEVDTIYLLVREKKGKDVQSRVNDMFSDVVFSRLRPQLSKLRNKIKAVAGDACLPNLGLSATDRAILKSNVNVIFHVAATVNFNEPIKQAYKINVAASKEVLTLAKDAKSLKVHMHVSTAYSNCHLKLIEEKLYYHPYEGSDFEEVLDQMSEQEANDYTERLLGNWPNTYTFTKALAEKCISKSGSGLPIGIFRPSIVVSTYKEPIPGWIDNLYGPTGIAMGTLSGVLRVMRVQKNSVTDMVPVDTCVAGLIAAAWDVAERFNEKNEADRRKEQIPIYNYVSSVENPMKWHEFFKINMEYLQKYPYSKALWTPKFAFGDTKLKATVMTYLLHYFPALLIDFIFLVTGKKPRLIKTYKKIHVFMDAVEYFANKEWEFDNKNVQNLWRKMSDLDRELFPLSMKECSWLLMSKHYIYGVRKYLLKDDDSTLEMALKRNERFQLLHNVLKTFMTFVICNFVFYTLTKCFSVIFC